VTKRVFTLGGAAVLLGVAFSVGFALSHIALEDWFISLFATLISAILAVAIFWYQREQNDDERQKQLLTALSAEAQVCLRILHEPPIQINAVRRRQQIGEAVLTTLPTTVLDETIRSGLHEPPDTYNPILMASYLQAHNSDVEVILSMQTVEVRLEIVQPILDRLKTRQETLPKCAEG
jgi:hypothetical protein